MIAHRARRSQAAAAPVARCYAQPPGRPAGAQPTSCKPPAAALAPQWVCWATWVRPTPSALAPAPPPAPAALLPPPPSAAGQPHVAPTMAASVPADAAEAFAQYDRNSSGAIEVDELKALLRE